MRRIPLPRANSVTQYILMIIAIFGLGLSGCSEDAETEKMRADTVMSEAAMVYDNGKKRDEKLLELASSITKQVWIVDILPTESNVQELRKRTDALERYLETKSQPKVLRKPRYLVKITLSPSIASYGIDSKDIYRYEMWSQKKYHDMKRSFPDGTYSDDGGFTSFDVIDGPTNSIAKVAQWQAEHGLLIYED